MIFFLINNIIYNHCYIYYDYIYKLIYTLVIFYFLYVLLYFDLLYLIDLYVVYNEV